MNGQRVRHGPDLTRPFTVMRGFVAVIGQHARVTLPQGATWPGLGGPCAWLVEQVAPVDSQCTADLELTWHVTPRDLESAGALLHAQLLCQGTIEQRLAILACSTDLTTLPQATMGHLIGAARDTVGLALRGGRPERAAS